MTAKTPLFLRQQQSTSYQLKGSTFPYLNQSKPLQLIMITIINGSILSALTSTFCFFLFIYFFVSQIYQTILYLEIVFVCTTFYRFYFSFVCIYVIVQIIQTKKTKKKKQKKPVFSNKAPFCIKDLFFFNERWQIFVIKYYNFTRNVIFQNIQAGPTYLLTF